MPIVLVFLLIKTKKDLENLFKLEIQIVFTKMILIKLLFKRTQSDKVLRDKAFEIATNPKYDGYQRGQA